MSPRLLITDLDNTLYDWVTYFAKAFSAMVDRLQQLLAVDRDILLREFKLVHQAYGTSEQPFAALEIGSVVRRYPALSRQDAHSALAPAFDAFAAERRRSLKLYPGVLRTLRTLRENDVRIVGHTEALALNAYYRLRFLGIEQEFSHLYALDGKVLPHPTPGREREYTIPEGFLTTVPPSERKPNPDLLLDICARESVPPAETVYIGDSLTRDMSMAKAAGVKAVWARYGTQYDRSLWDILVSVTHWTAEDVARENELKHRFETIKPDVMINGFSSLLDIFGVRRVEDGTH